MVYAVFLSLSTIFFYVLGAFPSFSFVLKLSKVFTFKKAQKMKVQKERK